MYKSVKMVAFVSWKKQKHLHIKLMNNIFICWTSLPSTKYNTLQFTTQDITVKKRTHRLAILGCRQPAVTCSGGYTTMERLKEKQNTYRHNTNFIFDTDKLSL